MERRRASIDWCFPTSVSHSHRFPLFVTRAASQLHPSPQHRSSHLLFLLPSSFSPISSRLLFFFFPLSSLPLHRYFRPLGLSAAVCLPIISPSPPSPLRRPSFFSMSTNNSLPFYPYFLFRFSPAYSKTAESPLFPSHVYALLLFHSSSEFRRFLLPFLVASIKAAVSKADRAPFPPPPPPLPHAFEIFPAARLFLPLLLSIEQCIAIRNGRLSAAPQRQIQYLISIGKSDECYLCRHCR